MAGLGVRREEFRFVSGRSLIKSYEAPILESPPAYRVYFCSKCGSPLPDPDSSSDWLEVPAGLLDDDPLLRPDKHIFVEVKSPWFAITDGLLQLDKKMLIEHRKRERAGGD